MRRKLINILIMTVSFVNLSFAQDKRDIAGVKTNLLFDAATALNIGFEIPLWRGFSLNFSGIFPDWVDRKNNRYAMQIELVEGQIRKYWNSDNIKGWYAGLYAQYGKGCLQWNPKYGYRINDYGSCGLNIGYVARISEHFALEYGIGLGYLRMQDDYYRIEVYNGKQYLASQIAWRKIHSVWPVPTQISVSVFYILGRKER